jgi:curved DNA-binding protein CbpA
MVSDGNSRHHHEIHPWPEVTSANAIPTPYQIFRQKKGAPYSKQRFYELVKLYHPDRHSSEMVYSNISHDTRLERYRLVVAANEILSDPVKRGAYDTYGAGWNGMPDVLTSRDESGRGQAWANYSGRGWGQGPGGPSQNATWEDWERWYERESGAKGKQSPLYFSNSAFVSLIVIFAALGGVGQATRVGNYSMTFLEQRNALHDEMSREIIRRKKESGTYSNREERIQSFLKQRDPYGYGLVDPQEERYRRLLPEPDICSSEDIKERHMDIYHHEDEPKNE